MSLGDVLEYVVDRNTSTGTAAANLTGVQLVLRQQSSHGRTIATTRQCNGVRGQRRSRCIIDRRRAFSFLYSHSLGGRV